MPGLLMRKYQFNRESLSNESLDNELGKIKQLGDNQYYSIKVTLYFQSSDIGIDPVLNKSGTKSSNRKNIVYCLDRSKVK